MNADLYRLFRETARRQPRHPAIIGPGDGPAITYGELDQSVRAIAESLRRAGLRPGDCVGLHHPSGGRYIALNYAVWRCGGCIVPVATELAADEKQDICRQIALDYVLAEGSRAAFLRPFCRGDDVAILDDVSLVPVRSPRGRPPGFDRLQAAFVRFTSGTTGDSKGVVLSHQTIADRIQAANEALKIGPADRVLWLLPMAYHFAVSIVSYLTFGATIVLPANHFAAAVVAACRQHRATLIYASPTHWAWLADYAEASPLPSLRLAVSTTSALDGPVARRFHERYGLPLTQALGIIEVGLPCINLDFAAEKNDSVGRVLPAYELRMEDAGLGQTLREISFRGKGMLDAYYHPWRTRDEILADGWFRTGDVGELDADGCLFLRGRQTDVISVMGMKFFPQEVEAVLMAHPAVAEAGVFAQRNRQGGEIPHARVVLRPDAQREGLEYELRRWCGERLASYKVPEKIDVAEALRRTASGKLLHRETVGGKP
jgi:long-chain acyl-CoA synthetase